MLHFMTVTITRPGIFHRGTMVTRTTNYLLDWDGVKNTLNQTRDRSKAGPNRSYNITLAAYRGQPLY